MRRLLVADDLTGASDAGVQFAKRGFRTTVWLDSNTPAGVVDRGDAEVVVVDTDSRALTSAEAYVRMRAFARGLPAASLRTLIKKIDSTLRGNAGAEVRALLERLPDAIAIVCPAYPRNGRTSSGGILCVAGTPVHQTDFGRDLFSPVRDSRIAAHLEGSVGEIGLDVVRGGTARLEGAIDAVRSRGLRIAVVDAERDEDLASIAALGARRSDILWVGSAGLIEVLEGDVRGTHRPEFLRHAGPAVFLVGSLSAMTEMQIKAFASAGGVTEWLDPVDVLAGKPSGRAAVERAAAALSAGGDVLAALDGRRQPVEAALRAGEASGWNALATSRRLREAFVTATRPLVGSAVSAVVLSGGDIARTFCEANGIAGMELLAEAAPGIPVARAIGAPFHVITKAGGFGSPATYRDIVATLRPEITV